MFQPIFKPCFTKLGPFRGPHVSAAGVPTWEVNGGFAGGDILRGEATIYDIDRSPLYGAAPKHFVANAAAGVNPNTGSGTGAYAKPTILSAPPHAYAFSLGQVLTWIEVLSLSEVSHGWSTVPIADMDWWYGGFKEPRVLTWGSIWRGLSDYMGQPTSTTFTWTLSDVDRALRTMFHAQYSDDASHIFRGRPINVRAIDDASRRALGGTGDVGGVIVPVGSNRAVWVGEVNAPFVLFRGFVSDCKPGAGLTFEFTGQDYLSYGFDDASQLFPRRRITAADFPAALTTPRADFPNVPATVGWPVPIIYGHVTDTVVQDATAYGGALGVGQVPALYVGTYVVGGVEYHKFLVAGHACKSIDALYEHGIYVPFGSVASGAGAEWLIPGQSGWTAAFGATPYEDINGNRYTVIYGKRGMPGPDDAAGFAQGVASAETVPLTLSVQGIEDVGDGSGTLIHDLLLQYLHCMVNWVIGGAPLVDGSPATYRSGAWKFEPVFSDLYDAGRPMIDAASFYLAAQMAKLRLITEGHSGQYQGDFILGGSTPLQAGPLLSTRDVIALFNRCAGVESGFDRFARFFISMEPVPGSMPMLTAAPIPLLDADSDILEDSLTVEDRKELMFNYVPYLDTPDYFGRGSIGPWYVSGESAGGNDSQYGARRPPETFEFPLLRTKDFGVGGAQGRYTRESVANNLVHRHWRGMHVVKFSTPYLSHELGTVVAMIHYGGVGALGYYYKLIRLMGQAVNVDKMTIDFEGYAIGDYDPILGAVTLGNF